MPRRGIGDFSRLHFRTIELADAYQGLALDHIRETFLSEESGLRLDDMSYGDFIKAFVEASEGGTRDEFEAQLAAQMGPILDMVFAPPPPEGEV